MNTPRGNNTKTQMLATAERRKQVVQLREAGATWQAIADTLLDRHGEAAMPNGYDSRYTYKDFNRLLDKIQSETARSVDRIREMELRRLDRLLRSVWQKALGQKDTDWQTQKEAMQRVNDLMKRRAKLLGLDEPEQHEVFGKDGGPLEQAHSFEWITPPDEESGLPAGLPGGVGEAADAEESAD